MQDEVSIDKLLYDNIGICFNRLYITGVSNKRGEKISEVWLRDKDATIKLLYKNTDG